MGIQVVKLRWISMEFKSKMMTGDENGLQLIPFYSIS